MMCETLCPLLPGDMKSTARCTVSEVMQKCFLVRPQFLGFFRKKPHLIRMQQRTGIVLKCVHCGSSWIFFWYFTHRAVTVCTLKEVEKAQPLKRSLVFLSSSSGSFLNSFSLPQRSVSDSSEQDASCDMHRTPSSAEYLLMLRSLWFYATIKHPTVAEHTGTYFLLQTNTHWALPTTSGEPVLPYCFFCCFSGYFTEGMRTNQLQTFRGKAHKF